MMESGESMKTILGVDIGSVSVAVVELDYRGAVLHKEYRLHCGEIRNELQRLLEGFSLERVSHVAITGSIHEIIQAQARYNPQVAQITAAKHLHPELGALLVVGGERFCLVHFGEDGAYRGSRFNSSCAAGTGSFLDQQASRLGLSGSAALGELAKRAPAQLPKIASRCAVFAKTDLIHAQQSGYSLEAICGGLCQGLAANVADVLFCGEVPSERPIVFAGGVALNSAVADHLSRIIGRNLWVDELPQFYGAIGAGLLLLEDMSKGENRCAPLTFHSGEELILPRREEKKTFYPPLDSSLGHYPCFDSLKRYEYTPTKVPFSLKVEVDIYLQKAGPVFLGVDIGSTSTKAVILGATSDHEVVAGFYTRTAGQPILAMQAILEAIHDWIGREGIQLSVVAAGTTGSGRKFIGSTIGADIIVDEITAHARAAYTLDPQVDTIIEIGGQDSKFTVLSNGTVTQSVMNHVCAAGTGSFIEEQAVRLNCRLEDFSARTKGQAAPLASDRCTVFMERDLNHFLSAGFEANQVLTAVLHSVRDNYLLKVARTGSIGEHICFQGATAKNQSLVAAFEQKLKKPIRVSKYCHITGALGVALILKEEFRGATRFRGLDLFSQSIPVRSEVCELCRNHCKLSVAKVKGEEVAFGFLCGRDYNTQSFVSNRKSGFDLYRARQSFSFQTRTGQGAVTIGLPAALYMFEQLPLWKKFFDLLGFRTVSSLGFKDALALGKHLAGAEFCAPMNAWHGHVASLKDKVDYIFIPAELEADRSPGLRRQFCYYTQFSSALVATLSVAGLRQKCLTPLIEQEKTDFTKTQLFEALRPLLNKSQGRSDVSLAYEQAQDFFKRAQSELAKIYKPQADSLSALLIGRPYTVLVPSMNKSIPDIFGALGIKTYFQDMIALEEEPEISELLRSVHWNYAATMLRATAFAARTPGLYPVVITSFKCTPDSCILEPIRRILDSAAKPYLILQLDEHDSKTGYETRIEAAVRAFQNHHRGIRPKPQQHLPINPARARDIKRKTMLMPHWDRYCSPLYVANLVREGFDARLLDEDELTIQKSLGHNTGQCIPLNAITQGFIDYVEKHELIPSQTVLWVPSSRIACNIGLFGQVSKGLLESYGRGFEKADVYRGELTNIDVTLRAAINTYFLFLFGGLLRRMGCKTRPYEINPGETDRVVAESLLLFNQVFLGKHAKLDAVTQVVEKFLAIPVRPSKRPKVALFGDLYTRDNDVINQNLISVIERNGGEVVTTPYTDYVKVIAKAYFRKWLKEGNYKDVLISKPLLAGLRIAEKRYLKQFERVLGPSTEPRNRPMGEVLGRFGVRMENTGESLDNLLKVFHLLDRYPDLSLFVQVSPAFCCPSMVTEAMGAAIERETGVPVVNITYDGTLSPKNDIVIPYLKLRDRHKE